MSTIYDWSLTASDNARCDDDINWSEGQLPSTVNNSARMMMQRVKEYLCDTGGVIENSFTIDGTQQTTAIRLESKSQFLEYKNGLSLRFKAKEKNVGATTVALNDLSSQAVYKATSLGSVPLTGAEIQKGCIYSLVYHHGVWHLLNPTPASSPKSLDFSRYPTGSICAFGMRHLPSGWLVCDGKAYSRSEYSALYEAIGVRWGGSESWTKFNVPDLRGVFLRGVDDDREIDRWRYLGTLQEDTMQWHSHGADGFTILDSEGNRKSWDGYVTIIWGYLLNEQQRAKLAERIGVKADKIHLYHKIAFPRSHLHMHDVVLEGVGARETRPVNISVLFGIKT